MRLTGRVMVQRERRTQSLERRSSFRKVVFVAHDPYGYRVYH